MERASKITWSKKDNLEQIKVHAKVLLESVPIKSSPSSDLVCCHPFTNTTVSFTPDGKILDIQNDKEAYTSWKQKWFDIFDRCEKVDDMLRCVNNAYELSFTHMCASALTQKTFSKWLCRAWEHSEYPNIDADFTLEELVELFQIADKKYLMSEDDDYQTYLELPDEFEVYRGVGRHSCVYGLSWTTELKTAEFFATRFDSEGSFILKTKIKKKDVLAYFGGRNENEIVVDISKYIKQIERI